MNMKYGHIGKNFLHKSCLENKDGSITIPKEKVELQKKQINTLYEELIEKEKDSEEIKKVKKKQKEEIL